MFATITTATFVLVAAAELPGVSTGAAATSKTCTAQYAADATLEAGGASGDEACALQHALRRTTRTVASVSSDGGSGAKAGTSARRHAAQIQRSWSKRRPAEAELEHELIFLVETRSMDELQQMLIDRSSPNSPRFRQWLSREEALGVEQNRASLEATCRVLEEAGATSLVEVASTFIKARAPVATWQKLLDTELFVYGRSHDDGEEVGGGHERVRAESYALPASLASNVVGVLKLLQLDEPQNPRAGLDSKVFPKSSPEPLTSRRAAAGHAAAPDQSDVSSPHVSHPSFSASSSAPSPPSPPPNSSAAGASACHSLSCPTYDGLYELMSGEFITPEVLRKGYKIPPVAAAGSAEAKLRANVTQLVYASLNQNWSPADRDLFQRQFGLPEIAVDEVDEAGAHNNSEVCKKSPDSCKEANLDVQYMNAMSPWSNLTFYYRQTKDSVKDFDDFFVDLLALDPVPDVVSISYGMWEVSVELDSLKAFDMVVAQYNLMGGSVFASSGDDGAAGYNPNPNCYMTKFIGPQVNWPASSPFVTAVGATMGLEMGLPEVVCASQGTSETFRAARFKPSITSGGGYSYHIPMPEWQRGHLASGRQKRGVPDVAFAGHHFAIALNGGWTVLDGTSASSPSFAGMISLINAKRKADGKGTLGFLNPTLYAAPRGMFNDIMEGDNACSRSGEPCCGGYPAGPGWDAATGLGTPKFERLFEYLTA